MEIAEEQEARQDERPQPEERDFHPAFFHPQAAERDEQDEQAEEQDGAAGADQREEQQGGQEGAQHRADRGERVQVAGDVAGLLGICKRDADGEGRGHCQQRDRDAEEQQRGDERSSDHAQVERIHRGSGGQQDGLRDDRNQPQCRAAPGQEGEHAFRGAGICRPASRRWRSPPRSRSGSTR